MKFSHIADCHIGGWRDPKLKDLNSIAFFKAIDISINENVDFIVIAGDLFNSALPGIDKLKDVVKKLKEHRRFTKEHRLIYRINKREPCQECLPDPWVMGCRVRRFPYH